MNVEEQIELQEENRLIQGRIPRVLLTFAGPYLVAILLQSLYGAADLFVVGRYTGSVAVSAVSIGSQMMSAVVSIFLGFSMGGTVLVGPVSYTHLRGTGGGGQGYPPPGERAHGEWKIRDPGLLSPASVL